MKISGRTLTEHLQLLTPLIGMIGAVWGLRLVLHFLGAPVWLVRLFSVSLIVPVAILLMVLLVHFKRFGGYTNVVVSSFILALWSQILIVAAILFAVLTETSNIYTIPEFSLTDDPNHTRHILGHLTSVLGAETLISSVMGCIVLFMLRRTNPDKKNH